MSDRIVVVGGGIAGLVCATELVRAGRHVLLLEREREVGGRVRSIVREGRTLDRGFQVIFEAYPTLARYADLSALDMRWFTRGAQIVAPGRQAFLGDALADLGLLWPTLRDGALPIFDLLRLRRLRQDAMRRDIDECFAPDILALSARDYLLQRGISSLAVERFFAPFYGGILLDRTLSASAAVLLFTFKMLAEGRAGVPARGMGALPARIASQLPPGRVRVSAGVASIMTADGRVSGVRLEDGAVVEAGHIVLATESPTTTRIAATAGVTVNGPEGQLGVTTIYFSSETNLLPGRALWLNAHGTATVSHAVTISEVAPEYAPGRTHLIAASIVGPAADIEDGALIELARADLLMMARKNAEQVTLTVLEVVRVPYAQYPQPPKPSATIRTARTELPGLWLSGEALHSSSLEGAARGGLMAASAVLAR